MNTAFNVTITQNDKELAAAVAGRLDANTSKEFDNALKEKLTDVSKLIIDFSELDYISSAGLRVLVGLYQNLNARTPKGELILRHLDESVKKILDMTGLLDMLTIEE
ncbi:MAG: STAS domain-containing protein [Lachnospiraceae bacterium]|nr:STAS domain-containing protein [Lachnospiraceae bacterium]